MIAFLFVSPATAKPDGHIVCYFSCLNFNFCLILIRWTDIIMIRIFLRVAKEPDDLLAQLNNLGNWGKTFSSDDIIEITKFYTIMDPMEDLFSSLNSSKEATLHRVAPIIKVLSCIFCLL